MLEAYWSGMWHLSCRKETIPNQCQLVSSSYAASMSAATSCQVWSQKPQGAKPGIKFLLCRKLSSEKWDSNHLRLANLFAGVEVVLMVFSNVEAC